MRKLTQQENDIKFVEISYKEINNIEQIIRKVCNI